MKTSVAIVTGASQGIGRSTALRLAKDFSGLVLTARNGEALDQVAALVREAGAEPLSLPLDLRERAAAKALVISHPTIAEGLGPFFLGASTILNRR
jgi:3-oxoacyl-[acyl-carrier protein] reductase